MLVRRRLLTLGAAAAAATGARAQAQPAPYAAWRELFAGGREGVVYWWAFGVMSARAEGLRDIPAVRVCSVRVCRVSVTSQATRVVWKEIGYYADLASGEVARAWIHPLTGERRPLPHGFEAGCGTYSFAADAAAPVLEQRAARPWRLSLKTVHAAGRAMLIQREVKTHAFPYPDGSSPEVTEPGAFIEEAQTRMWRADAAAGGDFTILAGGAPSWMVFPGRATRAVTRGRLQRTRANPNAFPEIRRRLLGVHPDYFRGGAISWD